MVKSCNGNVGIAGNVGNVGNVGGRRHNATGAGYRGTLKVVKKANRQTVSGGKKKISLIASSHAN
jgi:hypothetical protein